MEEIKIGESKIPKDKAAKVELLCKRCASTVCDRHSCPIYDLLDSPDWGCGKRFWSERTDRKLDELIKKWEAFDSEQALKKFIELRHVPVSVSPAERSFDKEKVINLLYMIYQNVSPHLSAEGVAARNYCFHELGKELFGEGEMPVWMRR